MQAINEAIDSERFGEQVGTHERSIKDERGLYSFEAATHQLAPDVEDVYDPLGIKYVETQDNLTNGLLSSLIIPAVYSDQNVINGNGRSGDIHQAELQDAKFLQISKDNYDGLKLEKNIPSLVNSFPSENLKRSQAKMGQFIDKKTGGLLDAEASLNRLLETMKAEIELDGKLYELSILVNSSGTERCLSEFIHKGGVAVLVQWAKEILSH